MKKLIKFSMLAAFLLFVAAGCTSDKPDPNDPNAATPNTFKVRMTDGPADFEGLDVEIAKVEAYLQGQGWVALENESHTYNVLDLNNGAEAEIASQTSAEVKSGVYTMLKITFGSNNHLQLNEAASLEFGPIAVNANGLVDLKFAGDKELIIEIDEEVNAQSGASILLDFKVEQSIRRDLDQYVIDPVIEEIRDAETGIRGQVSGSANAMVMLTSNADTFSTYINAEGKFLLRGMDEGMYKLTCLPARVDEKLAPEPYEMEGVVVTKGEIETIGTINF